MIPKGVSSPLNTRAVFRDMEASTNRDALLPAVLFRTPGKRHSQIRGPYSREGTQSDLQSR